MSSVRITTYRDPGPAPLATPALRERQAPSDEQERDPFAPPPKGTPDRPWQPRSGQGERWSDQQPERHDPSNGQFGSRGPVRPEGPRFDVTDPAQRRARYALLAGMWGLFFGLFSMAPVALLLGVLALYWGVSSLRAKPKEGQRPQFTAALSGILTGVVALAIVAASFTFQLAYRNYYSCVNDALTQPARQACSQLLPSQLRQVLGAQD
ncbi:hypothetical protein [Streptomyces sp. RPT161]|uniref:hypothetical protein n=1 Tax=Streptomyces sp. RPT161 TaxID=3015993 RepID=UPI0022B91CC4|nr:hypothetical protein [Streptomyces sp. RPT161]